MPKSQNKTRVLVEQNSSSRLLKEPIYGVKLKYPKIDTETEDVPVWLCFSVGRCMFMDGFTATYISSKPKLMQQHGFSQQN